jgi:uncharacterized membrane protein YgdD (TMEM256/DUF423 family)
MWMKGLFLLFLVGLLVVCPASAEISKFNYTRGETWIRWSWQLNSTDYLANETLSMYLDGSPVFSYALNVTPLALIPDYYYLTNLDANEQHSAKLVLSSNGSPPTTVDIKSSMVTTNQPIMYYYIVLVVVLLLIFASIIVSRFGFMILGIIFIVGSAIFSGYLAVTTFGFNQSFSLISILLCVISLAILIYLGYGIYDDKRTWRD